MNLPLEIVTTTFWLISTPFYFTVIAVLIAYRNTAELKSSFFTFSVSLGFADLFEVNFLFSVHVNNIYSIFLGYESDSIAKVSETRLVHQ